MKYIFIIFFAAFFFISCGKNSDPIPNVSVNFERPITDPGLQGLSIIGGSVTVAGYGVAGLILYHEFDGSYAAYDRCSSYQPEKRSAVTLDSDGFTVTDPLSGSKFSLVDGTPVKGPATEALKSYSASVINYEIFVSN